MRHYPVDDHSPPRLADPSYVLVASLAVTVGRRHGVLKARSSGYEPPGMYQMLVKFQPAEVKLVSVSICAVVRPVPLADVVSPEVVTFQKLLLTEVTSPSH
jgi:hypothetical protein